jgi:hypothetical protein
MSNQSKTRDRYLKMLDAYRQLGPNHNEVAKLVGCDLRTARSAYTQGWPRFQEWAEPIQAVLAREQKQARALRVQAAESADEHAAIDSIRTRAAEGQVIDLARSAALNCLQQAGGLITTSGQLSSHLQTAIARMCNDFDPETTDKRELVRLLKDVNSVARDAVELAHEVARLERTIMGDPSGPTFNIGQAAIVLTPEQRAQKVRLLEKHVFGPQKSIENGAATETTGEEVAP